MSLDETAWRHFANLYSERQMPLREEHEQKIQTIESYTLWPYEPGGYRHLSEVQPMERLNMLLTQIKHFAKELVIAFSDAFIGVHIELNQHPDEKDVKTFYEQLSGIPERCIGSIEEYYKSVYSPIKNKVTIDRVFELLHQELKGYPGRYSSKLNTFLSGSALREKQGLPLNKPTHNASNIVNVGKDVYGPIQVGAEHSAQTVIGSKQKELTDEQQSEAFTKISGFLLSKKIWKAEWVYYKEIAEGTGLEVWVIKECVEYASFLSHLKIHITHPDGILLVASLGGI